MSIRLIIYFVLLFSAAGFSFIRIKHDRRLLVFALLLFFAFSEDFLRVLLSKVYGQNLYLVYHIFVPWYYYLFIWYYYLNEEKPVLKKWMLVSLPVVIFTTSYFSFRQIAGLTRSNIGDDRHPGLQLDIIGFVLIIWSTIVLFNINVKDKIPAYRKPVFWIGISTLLLYAGDFVFYPFFSILKANKNPLADQLNIIINTSLNYLTYLLIIIGMICSKPTQKHFALSF